MPVPVAAYFEDGTIQLKRTDRLAEVNELVFESATPLALVHIDPECELAMVTVSPPSRAEGALRNAIRELEWTGAGSKALEIFLRTKDMELSDPELWEKLGLALYDGGYYREALEAFRYTAELSAKNPVRCFLGMVWQGHLLDLLGRRQDAIKCYEEALKRDIGVTYRHDQYGMSINREWVLERLEKPFQRK